MMEVLDANHDNTVHTAQEVANWFLAWDQSNGGTGIELTKLHALLYYSQGYYLAIHGRPLFEDDIHAEEFGPWIPTVVFNNQDKEEENV